MDVLSFTELAKSVERVKAQDTINSSWLRMIAAQGTTENMTKALKPLNISSGEQQNDLASLIQDVGKGF